MERVPFDSRPALISALQSMTAAAFIEEHMFDRVPFIFNQDRGRYVVWKRILAAKLEVDPASLLIVGSASIGRSLNPAKNLKPFDPQSDIDIAVVSQYHFTVAWRYMRANPTRRLSVDVRTRNAWDECVRRYIFWGTIPTDKLLGVLPFAEPWQAARRAMGAVAPSVDRSVNLRVYSDYEALRAYQIQSIQKLREDVVLLEPNA
jgi:hypothetical protein